MTGIHEWRPLRSQRSKNERKMTRKINMNLRNPVSLLTLLTLLMVIVLVRYFNPVWLNKDWLAPISWDVFGYYLYLPAAYIHGDLGLRDFTWVQQVLDNYKPTIGFYQAYMGPAGDYIMKYPLGLALLYSPFFFIAHAYAHFAGYATDGFTLPYQVAMAFGPLVYTLIGLWYFRKILLRFFSDGFAALTILVIVLGTNYFEQTAYNNIMPHNVLFTLFALVVWFTIRWHEQPGWIPAILMGACSGLAALVRPTDGIIVLVPLLWGLWSKTSWRDKINLVRTQYLHVAAIALAFLAVGSLQLIYWKMHAGTWLYYSYEQGESLRWIAPYIRLVLFSYKKGWLLYTPVMIFAIIGFIPLFRHYRNIFAATFVFFLVHLLIVSSWPTWWYGGSFSQRPMMEAYVLLALPMGAFVGMVRKFTPMWKGIVFLAMLLLVSLNLFQTWQYNNYVLSPSQMTKAFYWATFGKTKVTAREQRLLEPSNDPSEREYLPQAASFNTRMLGQYLFDQPDPAQPGLYATDTANTGRFSMRLGPGNQFSPGISIPYKELTKNDFAWIQACGYIYFTGKPEEVKVNLVVTCNQNGEAYKYRMIPLNKLNLLPNQWNHVCMDYMTPFLEHHDEPVQAYFWCYGDKEVLIDDIEIKLFEFED
jgi:hypothetical protein